MVRACCVLNCTSKKNMPSHIFPTNVHMREKWLKSLILKPYKENEISKLRICYEHFKESDYTGTSKYRRLNRSAVPFMTTEACTTQFKNIIQHQEQSILQETITIASENVAQLQKDVEVIPRQQEIIVHMQKDVERVSQADLMQLQINMDIKLSQMQAQHNNQLQELVSQQQQNQDDHKRLETDMAIRLSEMQAQHNNQLQEIVQEIGSLKMQLYKNLQTKRPNLGEITRKKTLSPIARKFYNNNIKLQAQQRRMKRIINKMKQQKKCKNLILNRRKCKG
ncbi:putative mediator of RNA polymerase II transcription subunit 26 [Solenopsis invicta]|uniref:putative mediator of RNA polymerase II transcription subunit 26 n=1 Tax=Solenopsis invicta TaxID=13686 RepID=UPI0005960777|nr:putative mediator of RNA polymerase II transcription subunit 26 [Solenopsis invicta]XP_025992415.1 putative mediator of RNA polymerase II transcription subunit 26 [Solenopsis invicta]